MGENQVAFRVFWERGGQVLSLIPAKYRGRPWSWTRDPVYLTQIKVESERDGVVRGIFFDTSGNARIEPVNPNAQYQYLWRTDEETRMKPGFLAKVRAVNRAHKAANELRVKLVPIFEPLVGNVIFKADDELLAKYEKLLPVLPNTPELMFYRHKSRYSLAWVAKVCESIEGESGCLYHEATVYIGELLNGNLVKISDVGMIYRDDYKAEEINELQVRVKKAKDDYEKLAKALYPFGDYAG